MLLGIVWPWKSKSNRNWLSYIPQQNKFFMILKKGVRKIFLSLIATRCINSFTLEEDERHESSRRCLFGDITEESSSKQNYVNDTNEMMFESWGKFPLIYKTKLSSTLESLDFDGRKAGIDLLTIIVFSNRSLVIKKELM